MGFFDSVLSVATLGVSDLVQGNSMLSGALDLINDVVPSHTFVGKLLPSLLGATIGTTVYPALVPALGYGILTGAGTSEVATMTDHAAVNKAWDNMPEYQKIATVNSYKTSGLLQPTSTPSYASSDSTMPTPTFTKTDLPKLTEYQDSKDKKIAEALTDEYKNYKLNDYMLYKQDPEHLQDLILRYT